MRRSLTVLAAVLFVLATSSLPVASQEAATPEQQLVQMPVAVDKLVEAGVPEAQVQRLAETLNRGAVSPAAFNGTLRNIPDLAANVESIARIGNFVVARVNDGLRGEQLAAAIHQRLREEGIPAGGHSLVGPPPIAENFLPENARAKVEKATPESTMNRNRRRMNRPTAVPGRSGGGTPISGPAAPAARTGGPPAGTPGR